MKIKLLLVSLFLFIASFVNAQDITQIEKERRKCIETNGITTGGSLQCIKTARKKYEKLLQKSYSILESKLKSQVLKKSLQESQKNWLLFKEKEFAFLSSLSYQQLEGTLWVPVLENLKLDIIKSRIHHILDYIDTLALAEE